MPETKVKLEYKQNVNVSSHVLPIPGYIQLFQILAGSKALNNVIRVLSFGSCLCLVLFFIQTPFCRQDGSWQLQVHILSNGSSRRNRLSLNSGGKVLGRPLVWLWSRAHLLTDNCSQRDGHTDWPGLGHELTPKEEDLVPEGGRVLQSKRVLYHALHNNFLFLCI